MLSAFWPFYQYLWTVYFGIMFMAGFWGIFYFLGFIVPWWLSEGLLEYYGKINKVFDPEEVRYKKIYEQEGATLIYNEPKGHGPYLHHHAH